MRARHASPVEIIEAFLRRAESLNPQLNAIVTFAPDALDRARDAEDKVMRNEHVGILHGVPVTIKDTIETADLRTTSGSRLRASFVPKHDAPAVARLKRAGAIVIGKTNTSEMAIPYECDNPVFGRTNNPHNLARTSGGSSGGCAAAVSACLAPAGLGSDLSGSIRVPAHFCGIIGLKPTASRVPSAGHLPPTSGAFASGASLGPLARRVEDIALMMDALTDDGEPCAAEQRVDLHGYRFAVWRADEHSAPITDETHKALERAAQALSEAKLVRCDESPPSVESAVALWFDLFARRASDFAREMYAGRDGEAGALVRAALEADALPDVYEKAKRERELLRADLIEWMGSAPLMIAPTGSAPAFEHGARRIAIGARDISVFRAFGYARAFNALDLPAIVVPAGRSRDGLPIGVQIVGRPGDERRVLAAAAIIEEALGGWQPPPHPFASAPASSHTQR